MHGCVLGKNLFLAHEGFRGGLVVILFGFQGVRKSQMEKPVSAGLGQVLEVGLWSFGLPFLALEYGGAHIKAAEPAAFPGDGGVGGNPAEQKAQGEERHKAENESGVAFHGVVLENSMTHISFSDGAHQLVAGVFLDAIEL